MAGNKNYANGVFAKEFEAQYGLMISLGIRRADFIEWLDSLEENDKGYINLTMGPNKEAPGWSVWENNYSGESKQAKPAARTVRSSPASARTAKKVQQEDDNDDLPF